MNTSEIKIEDRLLAKYTNEHSKWIEISGIPVHYRDEGEGDVLILLHGSFSSLHTFDDWTRILKHNFRIIRLDVPGFGLTGPAKSNNYSIELFVEFLDQFTKSLHINRFYLAGSSLGGWLSLEFAINNPDKVMKLILINSAGYIDRNNFPLPFLIAQTPVLRNVFSFTPKAVVRRFVRQVFYDQSKVTEDVVDRYYDIFQREGNKKAFVQFANTRFTQNTNSLNDLAMPVLIQWGKEDRWLNVENAYKFQEAIPTNQLIIYDETGHLPMEECPQQSAEDVMQFLMN